MQKIESWIVGPEAAEIDVPNASQESRQLLGPRIDRGYRGEATFDDGDNRFTVALRGPGALDWTYDPAVGELRILGVQGTDGSTEILVYRHRGTTLHVADARIDGVIGAFRSNALFGVLAFQGQRGAFTFCDGRFSTTLNFPVPTNVHYDGALGAIDATPADGSLRLETCRDVRVGASDASARLTARTNSGSAELNWRQIGGPKVAVSDAKDGALSVEGGTLAAGRRAVFVVSAHDGQAFALESVVVRGECAPVSH